jgi:hypothetical protein
MGEVLNEVSVEVDERINMIMDRFCNTIEVSKNSNTISPTPDINVTLWGQPGRTIYRVHSWLMCFF